MRVVSIYTHFSVLNIYTASAISYHKYNSGLDQGLNAGDFHKPMDIVNVKTLISNELDSFNINVSSELKD